ncbi:unnamed protein product [Trichobilharzia regenti]|nr:unnamed protein product [Trichobilharzia regenti]
MKESRLSLLTRIREARAQGQRLRIEEPVYDTVDEAEYAELVRQRLEDDWIIENEGCEYVDDGREIFDDNDEDEELCDLNQKTKNKVSKKKRLNPDIRASESAPLRPSVGRDIRSLFAASASSNPSKKRKVSPRFFYFC